MVTFIVVAQWIVRRNGADPQASAGLSSAGSEIWHDRLARCFGIRTTRGTIFTPPRVCIVCSSRLPGREVRE